MDTGRPRQQVVCENDDATSFIDAFLSVPLSFTDHDAAALRRSQPRLRTTGDRHRRDDDCMAAPIAARGALRDASGYRRSTSVAAATSRRAPRTPSPTVRAARMPLPERESFDNCVVASRFLHYRSDAARRFGDCLRRCAAGAAAQAPLGLNAGCTTAFIARQLERSGSAIRTPFGAWFSHPTTHLRC